MGFQCRGGVSTNITNNIDIDAFDNIYLCGQFGGLCDFKPNVINTDTLDAPNYATRGFVAKYDAVGNFLWANNLGSGAAYGVSANVIGNIHLTGNFQERWDFDRGAGIYNMTSNSWWGDVYVAQYDKNGSFSSAFKIGSGINNFFEKGLAIHSNYNGGNVSVAGLFGGTADFMPGIGTVNHTATGLDLDMFIASYSYTPSAINNFNAQRKLFIGNDTIVCSSIQLIADTGFFRYLWNTGDNIYNTSAINAGSYWLEIENKSGCIMRDTINVTFSAAAVANVTLTPQCDSTLLNGTWYHTSQIIQDTLPGASSIGCDSITVYHLTINNSGQYMITTNECYSYVSPSGKTYTVSGVYNDTIPSSSGCDSLIRINLTIHGISINTINIPSACDSVFVNSVWHFSSQSFNDTITNGSSTGCDSIVHTSITVNSSEIFTDSISICFGNSAVINGVSKNTAGVYTSNYNTVNGCDSLSIITLFIDTLPEVAILTSTTTISSGESLLLSASGANQYSWSNGLAGTTTTITPLTNTNYCVSGLNSFGCENTACVNIFVNETKCNPDLIFIPNAFSPNGDGENDMLCFYGDGNYCSTSFYIKIYDRWGQKVFESDDKSICWDGKVKSKLLNSGIYVYQIVNNSKDVEQVMSSGNIALVK